MRYRRRPSEVDAIQWTGDNLEEIEGFGADFRYTTRWDHPLRIKAGRDGAQGFVEVPVGHWVVRGGDRAHFWPIDPDEFATNYEPA